MGFTEFRHFKKVFWKEVEGYPFYSVTVRGYKFEKKDGCVFTGQKAVYHGPLKAIIDEEGHIFPRNKAVEICTDTASKLGNPPYAGLFTIINPEKGQIRDIQLLFCKGQIRIRKLLFYRIRVVLLLA